MLSCFLFLEALNNNNSRKNALKLEYLTLNPAYLDFFKITQKPKIRLKLSK